MTSVMWFRRDLRLADNPALIAAAEDGDVLPLFVLDPALWGPAGPSRRTYLAASLRSLDASLRQRRSGLSVVRGDPVRRVVRWDQLAWFVAPTLVVLALVVSSTGLSARLSFWYSRTALQELIREEDVGSGTRDVPVSGFRGVLPVSRVTIHNPTGEDLEWATIWIRGAGFINEVGFAYVPDSKDDRCELGPALRGGSGERYSGDWFLVESESF